MADKSEVRALMMNGDSDSDSDTTEFVPMRRQGKNFTSEVSEGPGRSVRCCPSRACSGVALTLSAVVNITLIILLLVSSLRQTPPTFCHQVFIGSNESSHLSGLNEPPSVTQQAKSTARPTLSSSTSPTTKRPEVSTTQHTTAAPCITTAERCGTKSHYVAAPKDAGYTNVFEDLSAAEISATVQYLFRQRSLRLKGLQGNNEIFGVELYVPTKNSASRFLDYSGLKPAREALVSLAMSAENPPVFKQYVVGPLPVPTYHQDNPRMRKAVPLSRLTSHGIGQALNVVNRQMRDSGVQKVLFESFGANTCAASISNQCLTMLPQKISFGLVNSTSFMLNAVYATEFPTIHPVSFQLVVSQTDTGTFTIPIVNYAGSTFNSLRDLVTRYNHGTVKKVSRKYPTNVAGQNSVAGSINLRGEPFPRVPHPPPRQYEAKGSRYAIFRQHIQYLEWSFNVRNSIESGPQVWDIRWSGERIVYELSLQEIAVLYAGANLGSMVAHLSDSAFGLGDKTTGLVAGVDCPDHASFLSTWVSHRYPTGYQPRELPNTMCVFEHNSGIPLRRHRFSDETPKYGGLVDHYLVVRAIIVEYNYDYILDFIFHANGAVETRVYATGYIMSAWFHYGEDPFGFKVHDDIVGSVHHHLFHFKVDLDVGSPVNRYETLDFDIDDRDWPWLSVFKPSATSSSSSSSSLSEAWRSSSARSFQQISFKHHVRKTEQDAVYHYNFDQPKYHVFYSDKVKNKFGNAKAYRLEARGFSKQLLPSEHPAVRSRKWMQYCMAVTERKEQEAKSSSIFSMYDADDPVANFEDFLRDDDSILDKDLVTWVTLGMHHIPHTEDIPNTPTVGTEASILLLPYNYFPEDPSMRSRDAVRVQFTRDGKADKTDTYGSRSTDFTCLPPPAYDWLSQSTSSRSRPLTG